VKKDATEEIIYLLEVGIEIDVEIINQINNGNIAMVKDKNISLFTFTDYIKTIDDGEWESGESFNTIEEAMENGIKRAKILLKNNKVH